jgi:hypothetical protein
VRHRNQTNTVSLASRFKILLIVWEPSETSSLENVINEFFSIHEQSMFV